MPDAEPLGKTTGGLVAVARQELDVPGPEHLQGSDGRWNLWAGAPCLHLIRSDGYVGYRARPAGGPLFARYLDRIFTARG